MTVPFTFATSTNVPAANAVGILKIANGGTNQSAFTSPISSVAGLVWFDGTSFQNDTTTSHAGYNATTNTFYANNVNFGGSVTLASALPVAQGGTGLTSLTANYIPYGNGTSAFSSSSVFNYNGTGLGVGVTSPSYALHVKMSGGEYRTALFECATTAGPSVQIKGSKIYELRSTNVGAGEGLSLIHI